jgi:hypothetical protein
MTVSIAGVATVAELMETRSTSRLSCRDVPSRRCFVPTVEEYLTKRGITNSQIVNELGWTAEGSWLCIPWIDQTGSRIYETRRSMNGADPKYKNASGPRPPLWASPAARDGLGAVSLCEGPFDTLAVLEATGMPGFATFGLELSDEATDELATHERVVMFPDNDVPGQRLVEQAIDKLARRTDLRIATLPDDVKDVADLLLDRGEEAVAVAWGNAQERRPAYTSWAPVDAAGILSGDLSDEAPAWLARSDGERLIYAGKMHAFIGEPETAKSWVALVACSEAMGSGRHAIFIDFEDSPKGVIARLRAFGVEEETLIRLFHYIRPVEALSDAAWLDLEEMLSLYPAITVLDGVSEAMALHGLELERNSDVAKFISMLPRRISLRGSAVISIDHVTKDRSTRGRYAIGAQHKLAGLDGAAYTFETLRPFGRGRDGESAMRISKDRTGFVRAAASDGKRIGTFRLLASETPIRAEIIAALPQRDPESGLSITQQRVLTALPSLDKGPLKNAEVGDALARDGLGKPLRRTTIDEALNGLEELGLADVDRPGNGVPNRWWKR